MTQQTSNSTGWLKKDQIVDITFIFLYICQPFDVVFTEQKYNLIRFKYRKPTNTVQKLFISLQYEMITDLHWALTSEFQLLVCHTLALPTVLEPRRRTECFCTCWLLQLLCWH